MKSILKFACFLMLFFVFACSNNTTENKAETNAEITKSTSTPIATPKAKPVLVDNPAATTAKPVTTNIEKKESMVKEKVVPVNKKSPSAKPVKKAERSASIVQKENAKIETVAEQVAEVQTEIASAKTPTATKEIKAVNKEPVEKEIQKETAPNATIKEIKATKAAFSHAAWNALAQKHISSTGKVNYKGFKADIKAFDAYLQSLADNPVQNSWSKARKMAYWINAYNAFTIKLIVDNYPVSSIMKLHGGKAWDVKWIKLGNKTYSLNNIEHDILRPQYKDARIHFAVNCAAKSCPPVWNQAWTAQNLEGQLERSTKQFINNTKYNSISSNSISISKIFEWYAGDFGNIITYLNKYATNRISTSAKVSYQEYDWALNE